MIIKFEEDFYNASKNMPTVVIYDSGKPIGFCTTKLDYPDNCNLYVWGILPEFHNLGWGTQMIAFIENYCKLQDISYMSVLTLSSKSTNGAL